MEYFELTADYIVSFIHQNIYNMLDINRDKPLRQWFKIFDGMWWERNSPLSLLMESNFVEQGFAMLDAQFAEWYFEQIFTERHLMYTDHIDMEQRPRESDFGPDLLWCGAAAEWLKEHNILSRTKPCAFSTFPVYHMDTKQLEREETSDLKLLQEQTWIQRRPMQLLSQSFPQWFAYSVQFTQAIGGHVRIEDPSIRHLLDHSIRCIRRCRCSRALDRQNGECIRSSRNKS